MSEQMSASKLAEAINQTPLMSPTPLRWQNAEALILADRKATVERCKEAAVEGVKEAYGVQWIDLEVINKAIDAVLEEMK